MYIHIYIYNYMKNVIQLLQYLTFWLYLGF